MTLKERLEEYYERYIKDGDSDMTEGCASRYDEFKDIYPELMKAVELSDEFSKSFEKFVAKHYDVKGDLHETKEN